MKPTLTCEDAKRAVDFCLPTIRQRVAHGSIVIMNPEKMKVNRCTFDGSVLYRLDIGESDQLTTEMRSYADFAANYSWSYGDSVNHEYGLKNNQPVVSKRVPPFNYPIAVSGDNPQFCFMYVTMLGHACYAFALDRVTNKPLLTFGV